MTLEELGERILRIYYGGDIPDENGIQKEDVYGLIAAAANFAVKSDLWQTMMSEGRFVDPLFIATYESVPVLYNDKRDLYYIQLPATPLNLNRGLGVYEVSPMKGQEGAFVPVRTGWSSIYSGLTAGLLQGKIGLELEGQNAYFVVNDKPVRQKKLTEVLVKMIQNIKDFTPTQELPIPPDYEKGIIDYCLARIQNAPAPDDINNRLIQK